MRSKGIRISDGKPLIGGEMLAVSPIDILELIEGGDDLNWALLELDASGDLGQDKPIPLFESKIRESEKGLLISWEELYSTSKKFSQVIWITIIGCKEQASIKRYKTDLEMYESCDIVIQIIDGGCCEVFSKDHYFIDRLEENFKKTEILSPDWMEKEKKPKA